MEKQHREEALYEDLYLSGMPLYILGAPFTPDHYLDCGGKDVRKADGNDIEQYWVYQKIIQKEIRTEPIPE